MITHQMKLASNPFTKIINGNKVIESRLYDEKRRQIATGDLIEFARNDDPTIKILTKVVALYQYDSFKNLFSDFSPELFGGKSTDELIEEIEGFYSKGKQQKYGVLGIKFELV